MYVHTRNKEVERTVARAERLREVGTTFVKKVQDKNENFNKVMRYLEELHNHVLSLQELPDELVNSETLTSMVELMRTLPTRDFEFSFLADLFMVLAQLLHSHKRFRPANLQLLVNRVCDALRHHLLPFLLETGLTLFEEAFEQQQLFAPRVHFLQRILELLNALLQADLHLQQAHRLSSGLQERLLGNAPFLEWMADLHQACRSSQSEGRRKI